MIMKKLYVVVLLTFIGFLGYAQCNPPTIPYIISTTATTANIGWVGGTGTAWEVQYGLQGFALGAGTTVSATSNTPTLTGLAGSSTYDYYVRTDCGSGSFSIWVGPVPFTTLCSGPQNAPVYYDFEGSQWNRPTTFNTPGTIGNCWIMLASDPSLDWTTGPPFFPNNQTGPSVDHTTGLASGQYIHMDSYGFTSSAANVRMRMPEVALSSLTNPELSFWYHMFGNGIDKMLVQVKKRGGSWVTLKTFTGEQQTSKAEAWKEEILSLSAFVNDTVFVRFRGYKNSGFTQNIEMAIDDVRIREAPNCPQPNSLAFVSSTNNSITLSWNTGGAANAQIEYGLQGYTLGTGTKVNVTTSPATVTGLNANTNYAFYVRDSCSAADQSSWIGPILARTDCAAILAPITENFNSSSWSIGSNFNSPGTINPCWSRNNSTDYYWDPGPPIFANFQSGPTAGKGGSGKYLYARRQNFFATTNAEIVSPLYDLSTLTTPELSFWYHMFGNDITSLEVLVDSGNGYNSIQLLSGQQHNSKTDPWLESVVNLSAYSGKTVKLKFIGIGNANNGNRDQIAIDDLSILEAPSCPKPTGLNVTFVGFDKATLSWTTGGATNWVVRYKTTGGAWQSLTTSNNPTTITGLGPNTAYEVQVRDSCGANDLSVWTSSENFVTNCAPVSAPYFENFNANGFAPSINFGTPGTINSCWDRDATTGYFWDAGPPAFANNSTGPSGDYPNGTGNYLTTLSVGFAQNVTTEVLTPLIDLSSITSPELSFWYHMFGNGITSLNVEINNGNGWTQVNSITGQQQTSKTAPWLERIVNLSSYGGDTVQLKFIGTRTQFGFSSQISIDDIGLYELPTCPKPTSLQFVNALATSATLSWTSGGASNYIYKYKPTSGTTTYGATNVNANFNLTGLTANTEYEFWVRDSCGTGDVSLWVGPISFRTDCNPVSVPFTEDFDNTSWVAATNFNDQGTIDACWKREQSIGYMWIPNAGASFFFGSGPSADNTTGSLTGKYAMTQWINGGAGSTDNDTDIETPWIDLSGSGQPELDFAYHMFGNQIDKLEVLVKKTDGTTTLVNTITGQQQTAKTDAWLLRNISLSAYTSDTVKIIFRGYRIAGGFNASIGVDDVSINDVICVAPSNASVSTIGATSVDVQWTSNGGNSNIQYGTTGFTLGQGTYVANVSSVHTLNGLLPFTGYDIYIKDSCAASNVSAWVGPIAVTTICDPATAAYSHTASNLAVVFNSSASSGTGLTYDWDFGDGNSSILDNPSHTYSSSGNYTVTLIVTDTCGGSDTLSNIIQVCDKPIAVINYSINGLTVNYDGSASVGAISYFWDLGNGIFNTTVNPTFTYSAKGTYNVSLIVTNDCGDTDTVFATIVICDEPTSFFTYKIISSGGGGMTVEFDGTLSTGQTSFLWLFGDGNTNTTSLKPTHVYGVPGLFYEVSLITYSSCGASDTMKYKLEDVVSVDEWGYGEVKVFPNPADVDVRVSLSETTSDMSFTWFDISGRIMDVPLVDIENGNIDFDVSALKPGNYVLVIQGDKGRKPVRIIIR
jgi:PKD repeat protein